MVFCQKVRHEIPSEYFLLHSMLTYGIDPELMFIKNVEYRVVTNNICDNWIQRDKLALLRFFVYYRFLFYLMEEDYFIGFCVEFFLMIHTPVLPWRSS